MARLASMITCLCLYWATSHEAIDWETLPHAYVVATADGAYYFKMTPDPADHANRSKGFGYAFKVEEGRSDSLQWTTSGWYAHKVFIAPDGIHLVRVGNWPLGGEPSTADVAVSFYEAGHLLASHSTAELIRDAARVTRTSSHYDFLGLPAPSLVSSSGDKSTTYFKLTTVDQVSYVFDVCTGVVVSAEQL